MSNRPNVILLVWDAVSARNTSLHGYHRDTTPFLDSFVEEDAVQYTQARATSSWTFPSHASMITGLYPQEHQATSKTSKFALQDQALPTLLEREGYRTVLMTNNTYLRAQEFGFSNSFGSILSDSLVSAGGKTVADPEIHAKVHGNGEYLSFIKQSLRSSSPAKSLLKGVTHKFKTSNSLSRGSGSGKKSRKDGMKTTAQNPILI
jgi:arylsulfatase A-like enzyme